MSTRAEKYEYLARIKGFIELYSSKETTNILDGSYRSVYRGRSLDFDDLREYAYGDNVRDVDWKSSSKAGKLLIRRFVAEKKHNVLFVLDSGEKMKADTSAGEDKVQVALDTLGVIAYLVNQAGDDYALMQAGPGGMYFTNFSSGNRHLEEMLREAERNLSSGGEGRPLADVLEYTAENLTRRMVICVITDLAGIAGISEKLRRKLVVNNDVLMVDIDDAFLYGDRVFDVGASRYEEGLLFGGKKLARAEREEREKRLAQAEAGFRSQRITMTVIGSEKEIIGKVIELFDRHRLGQARA
ncbi:MAG: DUF58 domain-containing protein [Firmicutes bacterium]|nr:DUF58 domain-containing protein [Bacillota bacterium]